MTLQSELLDKKECLLLFVDVQRSILSSCVDSEKIQKHISVLIDIGRILEIPLIFTEQNPVKLGNFIPDLLSKVPSPLVFGKTEFGCFDNAAIEAAIEKSGRKTILLAGIETHVCIFQTGVQGIQRAYHIQVVADAVSASTHFNNEAGLRRLEAAGAVASSTEMIIFELLKRAGTPEFRRALPIIKSL